MIYNQPNENVAQGRKQIMHVMCCNGLQYLETTASMRRLSMSCPIWLRNKLNVERLIYKYVL